MNSTYNNLTPRSLNNFGASRPNNRTHQGVDINFGSGNQDLGAPVLATHNGTVTRMVTIGNGDTDAGGNRIVITSDDGVVSTSYMHLEGITEGLTEGSIITEGQQIGTIGGTGNGSTDAYAPHLHYEVRLDGVVQNPENTDGTLMDPQAHIILDGGTLEPVSVDTQGNPPVRVEIPIPLPLPEDLSRQVL